MSGSASPEGLCPDCSVIDIAKYIYCDEYPGTIELGSFQHILEKSYCTLCKLVIEALSVHSQNYWNPGTYPIETCYLGRLNDTSRAGLEVWFHATTKTMPPGHYGHCTVLGQILPLLTSESCDLQSHDGSKPYAIPLETSVNYKLIKEWIEACNSSHWKKCSTRVGTDRHQDLILVDVQSLNLVRRSRDCHYLAMSYVWDGSTHLRTVKRNFMELQQPNALSKLLPQLPQLITDAIHFVQRLGETYLCVDALCIIQDDPVSKAEFIPQMDKIYNQALLTIIALNSGMGKSMLPGVRSGTRRSPPVPLKLGSQTLVAKPPGLFATEQTSRWHTRAWTFQEKMLARRCLYFTDVQVYWQCSEAYSSECCSDKSELSAGGFNPLNRVTKGERSREFNIYEALVKGYSPRHLTYPSDSLNAFTGILSALSASFDWIFASALPEPEFDLALLWNPMASCHLRSRGASDETAAAARCRSPTWCWTAWHGDIYWDPWRLQSYAGKDVSIKTKVSSFMTMDLNGIRSICRQNPGIQEREQSDTGPGDLTELLNLVYDNESSEAALAFEVMTVELEAFTLSSPNIPALLPKHHYSDFFLNTLRSDTWLFDSAGHHCGTLLGTRLQLPYTDIPKYALLLVSAADQDEVTQADIDSSRGHLPLEYPSSSEYYEQIFDTRVYRYQRSWALNVILVKWKGQERIVAERVAMGQMHVNAWNEIRTQQTKIVLV